ncbi:unnamed protein product [Peniophora sp. CBMAI 1063]|nr:unnamed protein product [Peniophora sp. CBMAI 1063]
MALFGTSQINTQASINRKLSDENLCEIFLALAFLDVPSRARPQGWFLTVNGVCRRWRYVAVHYAELWAISAGSFQSDDMTDLAIERAQGSLLRFDGHFKDHADPGYALTSYQLSLLETHQDRVRSFVHDEFMEWSDMLYELRTFPKLEMARIGDESGPDAWPMDELIEAPALLGLYMNNVLVPFNAPSLRYLRVDMDNPDWRSSRDMLGVYETVTEGCEATERVFPTVGFIMLLNRLPRLERLCVNDMPPLLAENLAPVSELHAELPKLRVLHLSGKSLAMGDFLRRLVLPQDAQIYIETDVMEDTDACEPVLLNVVADAIRSHIYDSLRISRTLSYDLLLQTWSSETSSTPGTLDVTKPLESDPPSSGPSFSFRIPGVARDTLKRDENNEPILPQNVWEWNGDHNAAFYEKDVARPFYRRLRVLLPTYFSPFGPFQALRHLDYTDVPWDGAHYWYRSSGGEMGVEPSHNIIQKCSSTCTHLVANWALLSRLPSDILKEYHLAQQVEEVTIVNFPCAGFPSQKRYDEDLNAKAWHHLSLCLERRVKAGWPPLALRLAESDSEISNMARSDDPEYIHTIAGSYEDAVRAVTQKGYEKVAPYVRSLQDLRIHIRS